MNPAKVDWTEENIATLRRLWSEGVSAPDIALQITGTARNKNAIVGKAHRLHLNTHSNANPTTRTPLTPEQKLARRRKATEMQKRKRNTEREKLGLPAVAPKPKAATKPAMVIAKLAPRVTANDGMPVDADVRFLKGRAWEPLPDTTPLPLEQMGQAGRDNKCHWPLGDGPFLFCAAHAPDGKVYCATHSHLSTRRL